MKKYYTLIGMLLVIPFLFVACDKAVENEISVMTFNIENGGTQVDFNKVVEAIKKSEADVVGIQEAWGNIPNLAKALRWQYYDQRQHIISKFPLYTTQDSEGTYVLIEIVPKKFVVMANMHLPDDPYGPDLIKAGKSKDEIEENERQVRLPTASIFLDKIAPLAKQNYPVFLTGDLNSLSYLDRKTINWPVTARIAELGFTDSYRYILPDPVKDPGYTWPAARPFIENPIDQFNPGINDKPARLDFIFNAGPSTPMESHVVDATMIDPWPSDHYAVVSRFKVTPKEVAADKLIPMALNIFSQDTPVISVNQDQIVSGDPIVISWDHAPGNRYDYIRIAPVNATNFAWGEVVRLYTHGKVNGSIQYDEHDVKGNWLVWHSSPNSQWPMPPGIYNISLMLDDGFTVLAQTQITIK